MVCRWSGDVVIDAAPLPEPPAFWRLTARQTRELLRHGNYLHVQVCGRLACLLSWPAGRAVAGSVGCGSAHTGFTTGGAAAITSSSTAREALSSSMALLSRALALCRSSSISAQVGMSFCRRSACRAAPPR